MGIENGDRQRLVDLERRADQAQHRAERTEVLLEGLTREVVEVREEVRVGFARMEATSAATAAAAAKEASAGIIGTLTAKDLTVLGVVLLLAGPESVTMLLKLLAGGAG